MLYELALNKNGNTIFLKDIAGNQNISEKYLSKLVIPLKNAGLVLSVRGAQGGYKLAKEPSDISIKEIVEVLEGKICPVECVNDSSYCNRITVCPANDLWSLLAKSISDTLSGITLEDLINWGLKKSRELSLDYVL